MSTILYDLTGYRYALGITSASKNQDSEGNVTVHVDLEVAKAASHVDNATTASTGGEGNSQTTASVVPPSETEVISLELTLAQFYQLLSGLEELRASLHTSSENDQ